LIFFTAAFAAQSGFDRTIRRCSLASSS